MREATIQRCRLGSPHMRLDPAFYFRRTGLRKLLDDEGTRHVPLADIVAEVHDGARLPAAQIGIPLVRLSNLRACEFDLSGLQCVDESASRSWPQARPGDVLFARSAAPFRAAVVPADVQMPITVSPEITVIRPRGAVLPEYLAALLSTEAYGKVLQDLSYRRSPTALRRLRLQDIQHLPVPLPGRSLQEEIRAAYNSAARLSKESREEISSVVRAVHSEIDVKVRWPQLPHDRLVIRRAELANRWDVSFAHGRLLRAALAEAKVMVPLFTLARPVPSSLRGIGDDDVVVVVQADDVNESSFLVERPRSSRLAELSSRMRQPLAVGDVLLCTTGQGEQVAYLDESLSASGLPLLGSATFTALRFHETPRFYAVALAHPIVRQQLQLLSSGTVQRFVNKSDLDELLVPSLGSVWREDFDVRLDRAIERRREALAALDRLLAAAQRFVQEGWHS